MIYQLANGKVIRMSVEDFLDLTDEDLKQLNLSNYGENPPSLKEKSELDSEREYIGDEDNDFEDFEIDDLAPEDFPEVNDSDDLT
jgi:hypothetical protein